MRPGVHSDFSRMTSRSEIIPSQKSAWGKLEGSA